MVPTQVDKMSSKAVINKIVLLHDHKRRTAKGVMTSGILPEQRGPTSVVGGGQTTSTGVPLFIDRGGGGAYLKGGGESLPIPGMGDMCHIWDGETHL